MGPAKIVARFFQGGIIKGYTQDFFPDQPVLHIRPVVPEVSDELIEVRIKDLKAIFFVRDFLGNRLYREEKTPSAGAKIPGRRVEILFKDKETMIGSVMDYDPNRPGFFLFPTDPYSNNLKVFVVSLTVDKVTYLCS
jgi:hypothetical protein